MAAAAKAENPTLRQAAWRSGRPRQDFVGSPQTAAGAGDTRFLTVVPTFVDALRYSLAAEHFIRESDIIWETVKVGLPESATNGVGSSMGEQRPYWDRAASMKTFTHRVDRGWLTVFLKPADRILDYGCGYGRVLSELAALGYANSVGVDFSVRMIARGGRLHPNLDLRLIDGPPLPEGDESFDMVMLFAVLTCIPEDGAQDALIQECRRLLRHGGLLYISDMPLQAGREDRERYDRAAQRHGVYGVFETADGAVVRHHSEDRLSSWMTGFEALGRREIDVATMNGTPARAIQLLASRSS